MKRGRVLGMLVSAAVVLAGCSGSPSTDPAAAPDAGERPRIVVGLYPLAFLVESVAGEAVDVTLLATPGLEPHDLELTPQQVVSVNDADLVITIPGFQPALDDAAAALPAQQVLDATAGLDLLTRAEAEDDHGDAHADEHADDHSPTDPHVWLDPTAMARMASTIAERLSPLLDDPTAVDAGLATLTGTLQALDGQWREATARCRSRDLVVSHAAFGYLARAYDFQQVGITGIDPDSEPTPTAIRRISDFVRANDVTTIYSEVLIDPAIAETIARETGAAVAVLDPIEGLAVDSTGDYVSLMRANLDAVAKGQGCT